MFEGTGKVMPRNNPSDESMTQGQVVKQPVYMPTASNAEGNESGVSTTAGLGAVAVQPPYNIKDTNIRNSLTDYMKTDPENYSHENRAAQYKYPSVSENIPDAGKGQYQ